SELSSVSVKIPSAESYAVPLHVVLADAIEEISPAHPDAREIIEYLLRKYRDNSKILPQVQSLEALMNSKSSAKAEGEKKESDSKAPAEESKKERPVSTPGIASVAKRLKTFKNLHLCGKPDSDLVYVRIISEVFYARAMDISAQTSGSFGA